MPTTADTDDLLNVLLDYVARYGVSDNARAVIAKHAHVSVQLPTPQSTPKNDIQTG